MQHPLLTAPPSMVDPVNGTRVWLFEAGPTVVDQVTGPITESVARFIVTELEAQVQARWARSGRKVTFIHDWRNSVSYEATGRNLLLQWGRESLPHVKMVWVQLPPDASPFVRIATATAMSALRLVRLPIDLTTDLEPLLAPLAGERPLAVNT